MQTPIRPLRRLQRLPSPHATFRCFHPSPLPSKGFDVLARFRRPPTPARSTPRLSAKMANPTASEGYETISTSPVGSSLQEVPPPGLEWKSKIATPVPAMKLPGDSGDREGEVKDPAMSRGAMVVQGVEIPPKPRPPGEEECCMSGCIHCVYTFYAEELEAYTSALDQAMDALMQAGVEKGDWPEEVRAHDGGEGAGEVKEKEKVGMSLDPSMAAFLALEGKLKKKQAPESSAAT